LELSQLCYVAPAATLCSSRAEKATGARSSGDAVAVRTNPLYLLATMKDLIFERSTNTTDPASPPRPLGIEIVPP
jgi:hypothetical protein